MNLTTFDFRSMAVRVMERGGQPWFVAADVCRVLEIANSRDAIAALDDDEKGVGSADTPGGSQKMSLISESGLYALIFKSRKPEAKAFRKWVTAEVLPAIRETGRYEAPGDAQRVVVPTVRDDLTRLRGLLLGSAEAVQLKMLDVGRAQQVANLAARFLETLKLEGDAIGYETMLGMRAGTAGERLLPTGGEPPAGALQAVPQCGVPCAAAGEASLPSEAVCSEAGVERPEPGAGAAACAALPGPGAVGARGCGGAAAATGVPGGAVAPAGGDQPTTTEGTA